MAGSEQIFQKAMNEGHSAAWEQNWERAAVFYRTALNEFPDHLGALTNLALALFQLKDYQNALGIYLRAARLSPEDPGIFEKLSLIYEKLGRTKDSVNSGLRSAELFVKGKAVEKAIENYHRIIALDSENLSAHTRLGLVYERLGQIPDAVKAYLGAASLVQQRGDEDKANQIVQYTLKLLPGSPDAARAQQLLRNHQPLLRVNIPQTPESLARTTRLVPKQTLIASDHAKSGLDPISEARQRALAQLADLLFSSSGASTANSRSQTKVDENQRISADEGFSGERLDAIIHVGQAIEAQTRGLTAKASEALLNAEAAGLRHPAISFTLGFLRAGRDDTAALRHLQGAVNHPDYALAVHLLSGKILADQQNYAGASSAYLQALSLADASSVTPQFADSIRQSYEPLILELSTSQDVEKLKGICESIVNQLIRPGWRDLLMKARTQLPMTEDGHVLPVSSILLESRSSQVIEAVERIRVLTDQGMLMTATEEAFRALEYTPTYLPLHLQIAELLIKNGLVQEAALKYSLVGQLYRLRGEPERAVEVFKQAATVSPMDLGIRARLLELLIEQRKWDEAVEEQVDLARIHYQMGALDTARQTYLDALNIAKKSSTNSYWSYQILAQLAEIDFSRLEWRQALRYYEQMLSLQPDNLPVRERIIEINFRLGEDTVAWKELEQVLIELAAQDNAKEGINLLKILVDDQPDKPQLRKRLIDDLMSAGLSEDAAAELDSLVDYYLASNQAQNAVAVVSEIMEANPTCHEVYQPALDKLRNQLIS